MEKTVGIYRISDAHEWINEIPIVPIYYLAKPQPRERTWQNQRGKKTLNWSSTLNGVESRFPPLILFQTILHTLAATASAGVPC